MVFADLTPKSVFERKLENRTTAFRILSSADQETKFRFKSGNSENKSVIDEYYVGAFQLNTKYITRNTFNFNTDNEYTGCICGDGSAGYAWLPCCSDGTLENSINTKDYVPSLVYLLGCETCKIV
jgi:hypothetical protein